ncbi:hypothetical protein D9613_012005 [Agrocybe pediades]|uniref:Uncharacterized protein n=1 Tax=Agrocybe pediades TaxID=84607 RepID=A0A8H4QFW5_9AGAR|nr:hypothetical protein D9613_012005 [Agrocybe pediades]
MPDNSSTETSNRVPLAPITINLSPIPPSTQMVVGPGHQVQPFVVAPIYAPSRRSQAQISRRLREAQAQALLTPPVTQATTPTQEQEVRGSETSKRARSSASRNAVSGLSPPAGTATISTIVVLENARQAEEGSPKTLLFDVHVYMDIFDIDSTANSEGEDSGEDTTPAEKPGTLACPRYFNIHHHVFDVYGPYFIVANIVKVHEGSDKAILDFPSKDLRVGVDYSLVGDITMLIPACSLQYVTSTFPFLYATACLTSVNKDTRTNKLTLKFAPEQFTQIYKEYNKKSGVKKTFLPIRCIIDLESKRWKSHVPNFQVGHIVTVSGLLSSVWRSSKEGKVKHFVLDIDQINIVGKASIRPQTDTTTSGSDTPLKRKGLQFDFSRSTSTASPAAKRPRISEDSSLSSIGSEGNVPSTPTPSQRKS